VDFGGVAIRVAAVEDLVVYKAVAWRDRDRTDIERLLVRHGTAIDLARVRAVVEEFATALEEPQRLVQFDALVRRSRGAAD
jgi:predicted nucleotidyltransferase